MSGNVKSSNFFTVQGWMLNDLELKGNDLLVYAIIYGFTQTGNQWFTGSIKYLAEWTRSTKQGIQKNLKNLLEKDKETLKKICRYKTPEVITEYQLAKELGGFGFYMLRVFDYVKKYPLFFLRKDFYKTVIK